MRYYAVARIDITDSSWVRGYVERTTPLVERHGGRYLARTPNFQQLEGLAPRQIVLLIEWPSREAAIAFYGGDEYRALRAAQQRGSTGEGLLVADGDDAVRP